MGAAGDVEVDGGSGFFDLLDALGRVLLFPRELAGPDRTGHAYVEYSALLPRRMLARWRALLAEHDACGVSA